MMPERRPTVAHEPEDTTPPSVEAEYQRLLAEESSVWGEAARLEAATTPPDWRELRTVRHNRIVHREAVEALLARVRPGLRVLELGCGSGWLALALARRGAAVVGIDLSDEALAVARRYRDGLQGRIEGAVEYRQADLNRVELPRSAYDLVVVKGVLHHLSDAGRLVGEIRRALVPGGTLWISDTTGSEDRRAAAIAGAVTLALPTELTYRDKLGAVWRYRTRVFQRVAASMQAEGLSPFEGAGRGGAWLERVMAELEIEEMTPGPAFAGYVSAQLRLADPVGLAILRLVRKLDRLAVGRGWVRSAHLVVIARKPIATS